LRRALRRQASREYVAEADAPFTSGNLTTQRMDVVRLPLAKSARLDGDQGRLFLVGLSPVGGPHGIGQ
jgi:hypothetical protein